MEGLRYIRRLTRYERILLILFLLSLPLVNPWVRGDGVGYYAYARALVVNGNLRFEPDWLHANRSFAVNRVNDHGQILPEQYTITGHLNNHFSVGPAVDWIPFLFVTHAAVRAIDHLGGAIPADGFSWPYLYTMALVTAFAGFFGLLFSFAVARKYFSEKWAFMATLGIWLASSLPVYMYFNPSWSHAHSAFAVALFVWYWDRTRGMRTTKEWVLLGLISALMVNMYYLNAVLLFAPLLESAWLIMKPDRYAEGKSAAPWRNLFAKNVLFAVVALFGLLPTLAMHRIIYGNPFVSGYLGLQSWNWTSPVFAKVLFSSDHGVYSWTPILIFASSGLFFLTRRERLLGIIVSACALAFYFVISCYPDWNGISSFGNRFFVSLTAIFVLGLAALFGELERIWHGSRSALVQAFAITGLLGAWNAGLIFQWGMHLIPDRGTFSWNEMMYNQFCVVPEQMTSTLARYFTSRSEMMQEIEKQDLRQLQQQGARQEEKDGS
ncbi:MAG TPA: hypothetical protein VJN21_08150 [Candidatus Acidoferrales bacterium]|nr:hypothetical protein [Candidatus Acidoferrales bacterium]